MGMERSPVGNLPDAGEDRVQDLRLQMIEGRHVAAHGGDVALCVLLEGHQPVVLELALLDGLVHRLADDACDGVGHPCGGHALQQRPHLGSGHEQRRQQQRQGEKRQGPQHPLSVYPPAVEVKSAPEHRAAPLPAIVCGGGLALFQCVHQGLKDLAPLHEVGEAVEGGAGRREDHHVPRSRRLPGQLHSGRGSCPTSVMGSPA